MRRCVPSSSKVCSLGDVLGSTLSLHMHVKSVTKTTFFYLMNISQLWQSFTDSVAESFAFVTTQMDYCNVVLFGISTKTLVRLQYVENSTARLLTWTNLW